MHINPFFFLPYISWWKWNLWNLEALVPMPSVIFLFFFFRVWGFDLWTSACSHTVLPHLSRYLGHFLFRWASSPPYLWTKTVFEKPWIYQRLQGGKMELTLKSTFQIKFHKSPFHILLGCLLEHVRVIGQELFPSF